ncbi:MAG: tRNA uridine-5-carboxymethylaminomethyl(34) synthesis GTPase MnmE [Candidatus Omnitrophica bacterium]|nr:tRNA uridine-5-carboxymethylaminomethyl(34) synthesis GTPase MnmE [Candidatus Omnitrophota bacterium]
MYQYEGLEDTIAAISTPTGQGGIGIVRLSGKEAVSIADRIFRPRRPGSLTAAGTFTVHYGWIVGGRGKNIDEVLVTLMRAPRSYTVEDVVEISCHGGMVALRTILQRTLDEGARLAQPGEFTKRAFLNGRIDLTQAEAVLDIIQSKTEAFLRVSTNQLKGELSGELSRIREELTGIYVELEAIVNFPEDELDADGRERLAERITGTRQQVEKLLGSADQGRLLKEGIKIVLCGKPNVGKSSLLNVLLKTERAIVSAIAGTTRDTIEETAQINGFPFQLVDTAGVLEPRDMIEEEAVRRSHLYMEGADLVLLLIDGAGKLDAQDEAVIAKVKGRDLLVVINKSDLPARVSPAELEQRLPGKPVIGISALKGTQVDALKEKIVAEVLHGKQVSADHLLISNVRHITALKDGARALEAAVTHMRNGLSLEFVSEEIKTAVNCLDRITGRNIDTDLLDTIFSQFCIGK